MKRTAMIRIIETWPIEYAVLTIDSYIPFTFSTDPKITPNPLMWRTGDLDAKMFEVAVDSNSHLLKYITLVSYTDAIAKGQLSEPPISRVEGVPVVDVAPFTERIIDHLADCLLCQCDDRYILFLNSVSQLRNYSCIQCGRAGFFCDTQGFLQAVEFRDLSSQEQATLAQCLQHAE